MMLTRAVWKLLRAQWWIFLNNLRRAKGRKLVGYILAIVAVLALAAGAFALSWVALSFLESPQAKAILGPVALESIPALMLSGAFLIVFLISFQVLLQALYLAGDMDFLLSCPIPARAVFIAKLLQAVQSNFLFFGLFMLPVLWGLGAAKGYNALYYPLALVLWALQVLTAAGLSALLVMAVVRIFPARRVFEVISFLGAILGMLCSQWYNLSRLSSGSRDPALTPALGQTTGVLNRFNVPWSPLAWPGLGLVALGQGQWLAALGYLTLSVGLAVGAFMLSLSVAERLYYSGWARVRAAPARRPRRVAARPDEGTGRLPLLSPSVSGIVQKDLRMLRRDLRNLSQLLSPVIFAVIYAVMILSQSNSTNDQAMAMVRQYTFYFNVFIALFACWSLASRLGMMSFSQEGRYYWILKVAPVRAGQLALAKWLVAFLPSAGVGSLLLVGISIAQRAALGDVIFGWVVVVLVVAGTVGLNLAFGITGAKLDWSDPRRMTSGGAGCLAALLGFGFEGLSLALFLGPGMVMQALRGPVILGRLGGLVLGGLLCAAVAVLPPRLVLKRVQRIGEDSD